MHNTRLSIMCLAILSMLGLSGCSSINETKCATMNWHELGLSKGINGKPKSSIDKYSKRCGHFDLPVDNTAFAAGYAEGIAKYCSVTEVYRQAQKDSSVKFRELCPQAQLEELENAYELGREYHEASSMLEDLHSRSSDLSSQERKLYSDLKGRRERARQSEYAEVLNAIADAKEREYDEISLDLSSQRSEIKGNISTMTKMLLRLEAHHLHLLGLDK